MVGGRCLGDFDVIAAFPAVVAVETLINVIHVEVIVTPSDDRLDPSTDLLSDLDTLNDFADLEAELLKGKWDGRFGFHP